MLLWLSFIVRCMEGSSSYQKNSVNKNKTIISNMLYSLVRFTLWPSKRSNFADAPYIWKMCTSLPGWCGSVDRVPACEPKGCRFNSQSRHMPGFRAMSPVGSPWEATTHWCFYPSLSLFLPLSLKINKILKKEKYAHLILWYRILDEEFSSC